MPLAVAMLVCLSRIHLNFLEHLTCMLLSMRGKVLQSAIIVVRYGITQVPPSHIGVACHEQSMQQLLHLPHLAHVDGRGDGVPGIMQHI